MMPRDEWPEEPEPEGGELEELEEPPLEDGNYPHGAEIDDDPPGVAEGDLDESQPGLSEAPPQAD